MPRGAREHNAHLSQYNNTQRHAEGITMSRERPCQAFSHATGATMPRGQAWSAQQLRTAATPAIERLTMGVAGMLTKLQVEDPRSQPAATSMPATMVAWAGGAKHICRQLLQG